jgi:hypothetical protein
MPPKGAKGGKSKVEPPTAEAKVFQTRSSKAGLQVSCVPYTCLTSEESNKGV